MSGYLDVPNPAVACEDISFFLAKCRTNLSGEEVHLQDEINDQTAEKQSNFVGSLVRKAFEITVIGNLDC
jgi:hypothetical protein